MLPWYHAAPCRRCFSDFILWTNSLFKFSVLERLIWFRPILFHRATHHKVHRPRCVLGSESCWRNSPSCFEETGGGLVLTLSSPINGGENGGRYVSVQRTPRLRKRRTLVTHDEFCGRTSVIFLKSTVTRRLGLTGPLNELWTQYTGPQRAKQQLVHSYVSSVVAWPPGPCALGPGA